MFNWFKKKKQPPIPSSPKFQSETAKKLLANAEAKRQHHACAKEK